MADETAYVGVDPEYRNGIIPAQFSDDPDEQAAERAAIAHEEAREAAPVGIHGYAPKFPQEAPAPEPVEEKPAPAAKEKPATAPAATEAPVPAKSAAKSDTPAAPKAPAKD